MSRRITREQALRYRITARDKALRKERERLDARLAELREEEAARRRSTSTDGSKKTE